MQPKNAIIEAGAYRLTLPDLWIGRVVKNRTRWIEIAESELSDRDYELIIRAADLGARLAATSEPECYQTEWDLEKALKELAESAEGHLAAGDATEHWSKAPRR